LFCISVIMARLLLALSSLLLLVSSDPTVYFREDFADGDAWSSRWIQSEHSGKTFGKLGLSAGEFFHDEAKDTGLKTLENARFYGISTPLTTPVESTEGKTLVVQFSVKHEQKIDCGGGYIKLFPSSLDPKDLHGDAPYNIMFGPDICGPSARRVHVIFNYRGQNLLLKKEIRCKDDELTHLYTLIVRSDNTYEVRIDNKKEQSGKLEEDWDFLEPKEISDPDASQPEDWDDNPFLDDPDDKKPEDWDQPETIPDPDAKKPADWDDDMDGEWEPPVIDNPDFKGEWRPKQIDNPKYQGEWEAPMIANPKYFEDDKLYLQKDIKFIGIDIWQVKSGSIFDNILVTDDEDFARNVAKETFEESAKGEKEKKEAKDEIERKKREEERKAREAEEAAAEADDEEEDDLDDDESAFAEDAEVEEAGATEAAEEAADPEEEAETKSVKEDVKDEL